MAKRKKLPEPAPYPFPKELYTEMEEDTDNPGTAYSVTWPNLDEFKDGTFVGVYRLAEIKRLRVKPALKELK